MPPRRLTFTPAPTVRRYALDTDTVLFDSARSRIYVLNESAALVWQAFEGGLDAADIARHLAGRTGADPKRVLADCLALTEQWTTAGLVDDGNAPARPAAGGGEAQEAVMGLFSGAAASPPASSKATALAPPLTDAAGADPGSCRADSFVRAYRIADLRVALRTSPEGFRLLEGLIDHCAVPGEPAGDGDDRWATLEVTRRERGWEISLDGIGLTGCDADDALAPTVHGTLVHLGYVASAGRLAIHGAAVFSGEYCLLLPGRPGAGKSTLTAGLVGAGLGYAADDLTLLDGDPLRLRGIPLCMGLKSGSWALLEGRIPTLGNLPIWRREDGQRVRYLAPPTRRMAGPEKDFRVRAVVFPRVVPGEPCRLDPMARSAALLAIADCGYHLMGDLDTETLEAMLDWIASLDCYELTYSALDAAVETLGGLLDPGALEPGALEPGA